MAKEVSYEGILWGTQSWFPSQANSSYGIKQHGDKEKVKDGDNSLGANIMSYPNQMSQIDQEGLVSGAVNNGMASACGREIKSDGGIHEIEKDDAVASKMSKKGKGKKRKVDNETNLCRVQLSSETKRLKKISKMFCDLLALLPELQPKTDRVTIVEEAITLITSLKKTIHDLEEKKLERLRGVSTNANTSSIRPSKNLVIDKKATNNNSCSSSKTNLGTNSTPSHPILFETWTSSNVTLNVCGFDAQINICTLKKPGLLSTICFILEKKNLEVVSTFVSSNDAKIIIMIHVRGKICCEFGKGVPYKDIYKQAADEIMLLVTPESEIEG